MDNERLETLAAAIVDQYNEGQDIKVTKRTALALFIVDQMYPGYTDDEKWLRVTEVLDLLEKPL